MTAVRAAVLASGAGSNLEALLGHLDALGSRRSLDVVVVASDRPGAGALERARRHGISADVLQTPRVPDGEALDALLTRYDVELVVLAGYLRLVPPEVTRAYAGRMINVHPGPLPRFGGAGMYGARVHRAVLESGVARTGPTVHLVDEIYDHGAVLAHWPVPVLPGDDEQRLADRVLRAEHLLFPRVVQQLGTRIAQGVHASPVVARLPVFDPALDDVALSRMLDNLLPSE